MRKYFIILASLILALTWFVGCDDRGTGITRTSLGDVATGGAWASAETPMVPHLTLQLRNPGEELYGTAYLPPEATAIPVQHPIPLLILLAPEGGTKWHYFKAGLDELVKDLTASGKIQPMAIYCVGNDQTFGGYFYGDSDPAGHYDGILADDGSLNSLVNWLHYVIPATQVNPLKRGIGGVGQGAYGAFRAAIKHPGLFHSVTVADGPLDFDGATGSGGLIDLFDDVLMEQEARYLLNPKIDTIINGPGDTTFLTIPFDFKRDFDSSYTMPISRMITGGALAFSPNDTLVYIERDIDTSFSGGIPIFTKRVYMDSTFRIADSLLVGGGDSTTFIGNLIKVSELQTRGFDFDFHLPFDATGAIYAPIWDRWLNNNLEVMHADMGGLPLQDVNMWIASTPSAHNGYYDMTQSWISYLTSQGYNFTEYDYSSYNGDPVTEDEYLFDLLREMLIFHSESFGQ